MNILGISAFYHDAAAALVCDGKLTAAAQEERFTRRKHDERFPINAIRYCLDSAAVGPGGIDAVVYYDKPVTTFVRLLRTYLRVGPAGFSSFRQAIPLWMGKKLWIPYLIEKGLGEIGYRMPENLYFTEGKRNCQASQAANTPQSAPTASLSGVPRRPRQSAGLCRGGDRRPGNPERARRPTSPRPPPSGPPD